MKHISLNVYITILLQLINACTKIYNCLLWSLLMLLLLYIQSVYSKKNVQKIYENHNISHMHTHAHTHTQLNCGQSQG